MQPKKKGLLLGLVTVMLLSVSGCVTTTGAGCEVFAVYRSDMPDPTGSPRAYLDWLNTLDREMLTACGGTKQWPHCKAEWCCRNQCFLWGCRSCSKRGDRI
jgi:hypothetical protein